MLVSRETKFVLIKVKRMRLVSTALVIICLGVCLSACSDLPDVPENAGTDAVQTLLDADMPVLDISLGSADSTIIDDAGSILIPTDMDTLTPDMASGALDLSVSDAQILADSGRIDLGAEDMSAQPQMDAMVMDINPPERQLAGLPLIHDFSGADIDRVNALVRRAVEGLGLSADTAPNERDRIFVGRTYMVWLDETGFYGKMNGLWPLNGDARTLDFLLLDGLRPVNLLIVGEDGNGYWPGGYQGSEHIEFPNTVPEEDDNPDCAEAGSFCAQYSLGEANPYTDPDIPTWRACNAGRPSFDTHFSPISIVATNRGLRIMYEGPLTKQGDFGGSTDGNGCHQNYLFPDGVRRLVNLRVGYELHVDDHSIDRLLQVRNPVGNPTFDGPFNFIGGFVMTQFPNPHRLKGLDGYLYLDQREVSIQWNDRRLPITPRQWIPLPTDTPARDVVLGWANQRVSLSAFPNFVKGRALSISNHGPNENGDSGFCLCVVHGGIEMGGGLRTGPVDGGRTSDISIRRLI